MGYAAADACNNHDYKYHCCNGGGSPLCTYCSAQCTGTDYSESSCNLAHASCIQPPVDCEGKLAAKASGTPTSLELPIGQSEFHFSEIGVDYLDFYEDTYAQKCKIGDCKMRTFDGSVCTSTLAPIGSWSFVQGQDYMFKLSTVGGFLHKVCIECNYYQTNSVVQQATPVELTALQLCTSPFVDFNGGTSAITLGSHETHYENQQQLVFGQLVDQGSQNCGVEQYMIVGESDLTTSSDLSVDHDVVNNRIKIGLQSPPTNKEQSYRFRLYLKLSGNRYMIYQDVDGNEVIDWKIYYCQVAISQTTTYPASRSQSQWAAASGSDVYFALPTFTNSDTVNCAVVLSLAYADDKVTLLTTLSVSYDSGGFYKVVPSDIRAHAQYTFYIKQKVTDSIFKWSDDLFTLTVGCPAVFASFTSSGFPNSLGQTQYVYRSDGANTRFYLEQLTTPYPSKCPISDHRAVQDGASVDQLGTLTTAGVDSNGLYYVDPVNKEIEAAYTFFQYAAASGPSTFYSASALTLVVGCPEGHVSFSHSFSSGLTTNQYVSLDSDQIFELPTFIVTSQQSSCAAIFRELHTQNTNASPAPTDLVLINSNTQVQVSPKYNAAQAIVFWLKVATSTYSGAYTQFYGYKLIVGCADGEFSYTPPTLETPFGIASGTPDTKYVFQAVIPDKGTCTVESYATSSTGVDGQSSSSVAGLSGALVVNSTHMSVAPTSPGNMASYTFFIGFKFLGQSTYNYLSMQVTFNVLCGHGQISVPTVSASQVAGVSFPKFSLPSYTETSGCVFTGLKTTAFSDDLQSIAGLNDPVINAGSVYVTGAASHAQCEFHAYIIFADGGRIVDPTMYTLTVGCYGSTGSADFSNGANVLQYVPDNDSVNTKFLLPTFSFSGSLAL